MEAGEFRRASMQFWLKGDEGMADYEQMLNSLISIGSELQRFEKVFLHAINKLDADEQNKYISQFNWFSRRVDKALVAAGLTIVNLEGKKYDPGMAVTPVNIDEFDPADQLYVTQMIEPVIMSNGSILRTGTVLLGRIE